MTFNLRSLLPTWNKNIKQPESENTKLGGLSDYNYYDYYYSNLSPLPFDGEKTPYELGVPLSYYIDYQSMRARAWESYIKSDVVQNAIRKYCLWIVGAGLKLQSNPDINVLQKYKVSVTKNQLETFQKDAESLFRLYANSNCSVYSKMNNLHYEGAEALKNALLAGDVLCIERYDGKRVSTQTIDGYHIQTPVGTNDLEDAKARGNTIKEGVEIDPTGKHIAFYVYEDTFKYKRIPAYGEKTGYLQAWLMYGLRYKKDHVRGMSLLTAVLESSAVMDRYKDATLSAAEENAKIPFTIEHNQFSDGENPLIQQLAQSMGKDAGTAIETRTKEANALATKIAQTTKTQTYNMPIGAGFKRHAGSSDVHFKDFFGVNIDIIYATLGIPPEVAMDKFGGAYSGSRAALKSWEYKMMVDRIILMKNQFYKPAYDYWLSFEILENRIQAPGYIMALRSEIEMILEAYRNCRFIGMGVPHIDPIKEVNAERTKLGKALESVPLSSIEEAMERLNTGDYEQTINKIKDEIKMVDDFVGVSSNND